ncbi:GNAT family N-acetyltransferase [Rhodobacter calidifons]|uniref:GNAT family N-acetyltransferase n=1 Tax=Rhodobacter calidifons TaxID=2715277 RepID=UPI00349F0130
MARSLCISAAEVEDLDLLWIALAMAAQENSVEAARRIPVVAAHLEGWRRPGDFGVLARRADGGFLGAAWARQFRPEEGPTFHFGDRCPEVTIGVAAEARGQGVGRALLQTFVAQARLRGCGLSLNVRETNPAIRLYERLGFVRVPGAVMRNRSGTLSVGMRLD